MDYLIFKNPPMEDFVYRPCLQANHVHDTTDDQHAAAFHFKPAKVPDELTEYFPLFL
jgi:hypothetical protein